MQPQDELTPAPEVEPPTVTQVSPPPEVVATPVARVETVPTQSPYVGSAATTNEEPKKRQLLHVIVIAIAILMLLGAAGLALFYFGYRTPNSEYDTLLRNLRSMREDTKIIPKKDMKLDDTYQSSMNDTQRAAAKNYITKLDLVQSSLVLLRDEAVKKSYSTETAVLQEYGKATIDAYETADILQEVTSACDSGLRKIGTLETYKEFDEAMLECMVAMDKYPTVPLRSFNAEYYQQLLRAYNNMINAFGPAYKAYETKQYARLDAMENTLMEAQDYYKDVTSNKPKLTNTKNPGYILDDMIRVTEQRKTVFFRR